MKLLSIKRAAFMLVAAVATFLMHRAMRRVYYHRCDYDIFQVLFFRNSHMCTFLSRAIGVIEGEYFILLRGAYSVFANT